MSKTTFFGIPEDEVSDVITKLRDLCDEHGMEQTTIAMIAYSSWVLPVNVYFGDWHIEAVEMFSDVFRKVAEQRVLEVKECHEKCQELKEKYGHVH